MDFGNILIVVCERCRKGWDLEFVVRKSGGVIVYMEK